MPLDGTARETPGSSTLAAAVLRAKQYPSSPRRPGSQQGSESVNLPNCAHPLPVSFMIFRGERPCLNLAANAPISTPSKPYRQPAMGAKSAWLSVIRGSIFDCAGHVGTSGAVMIRRTGMLASIFSSASIRSFRHLSLGKTGAGASLTRSRYSRHDGGNKRWGQCRRGRLRRPYGAEVSGQAAVLLASSCRHVHLLVRSKGLADSMSDYLIRRITDTPNITLHANTEISSLEGQDRLERVVWRNAQSDAPETHAIGHVFLMTGAVPSTHWLRGCIRRALRQRQTGGSGSR